MAGAANGSELSRVDLASGAKASVLGAAQVRPALGLRLLSMLRHEDVIVHAREAARAVVNADPSLTAEPNLAPRGRAGWRRRAGRLPGGAVTHIVAGTARAPRRLAVPPGTATRPTSDRAREGLFSALGSGCGGSRGCGCWMSTPAPGRWPGGASRAALRALLLVEIPARRAAAVVADNAAVVGGQGADVRAAPVATVLATPCADEPYDLVFLDPPYAVDDDDVRRTLGLLRHGHWSAPGTVVVVERATRGGDFAWPEGFVAERDAATGRPPFGTVAPPSREPPTTGSRRRKAVFQARSTR